MIGVMDHHFWTPIVDGIQIILLLALIIWFINWHPRSIIDDWRRRYQEQLPPR